MHRQYHKAARIPGVPGEDHQSEIIYALCAKLPNLKHIKLSLPLLAAMLLTGVAGTLALAEDKASQPDSTAGEAVEPRSDKVRPPRQSKQRPPNVLFLVMDDLNDWVGYLGGHPLVQTPHLDRLAARGTAFLNAHVQAPICGPSRTSVMLGLRPSTTGLYDCNTWFRTVPEWREAVTLPQYFAAHGYRTLGTGKLFHRGTTGGTPQGIKRLAESPAGAPKPEFQVSGGVGGVGVCPPKKLIPPTPMGNSPLMDWGVFPHNDEDKGDYRAASWAIDQLQRAPRDRPFFLAIGFVQTHVPLYAPKKWFDLYPDDDRVLPAVRDDDRADTPRFSWYLHWRLPEPRLNWVKENNQWRNLVRSYLACTSFVDAQVGRILDALDAAGLADNTIVVVWSDNGYHLGEKLITGKNTLWERSTRVPLIFAGPGVTAGQRCARPAELLDLYPTLLELCGLPPRKDLDGLSLATQLRIATAPRERPAITTHGPNNHGIRSERWRYIRYADGSEELYDLLADQHEWMNLASGSEHPTVLESHRRQLPRINRPPVPGDNERLVTRDSATGEVRWEGKVIHAGDPVPE